MEFYPFATIVPELKDEVRSFMVLERDGPVPRGAYVFEETYCADPACDCRKVIFSVMAASVRPPRCVASIDYGWETGPFYTRWLRGDTSLAREMIGVSVNNSGPQSPYTDWFRAEIKDMVARDRKFVRRIQRHYRAFKDAIVHHPDRVDHKAVVRTLTEELLRMHPVSDTSPAARTGRNAPCPCGATRPDGAPRKYKHCCGA